MLFDASCDRELNSPASSRAPEGWLAFFHDGMMGYGRSRDFRDPRFDIPSVPGKP